MPYNDHRQESIVVQHAYNGVVLLPACTVCGAVVIGEGNQMRHDSFHNDVQEVRDAVWKSGLLN